MAAPVRFVSLILFALLTQPGLGADGGWKGKPLRDFIESLTSQGLRIIYSSNLVRDEYTLAEEPAAADPEGALRAALLPYGLTVVNGPANSLLITRIGDEQAPGVGSVQVTVIIGAHGVEDARVSLDGVPAGRTDRDGQVLLGDIAAGPHWLVVLANGFVRSSRIPITVTIDTVTSVEVELREDVPALSEVIVTASRYSLAYQIPQPHTFLDRDLITALPSLGDEAVRAVARLPGTANGGISARHHVRGGEANEVLFVLDGLRLYEPYHLKDFQSFVTIIDQSAIAGIDFYSGGYPARYGDRMSGVMDMSLREPIGKTETELGLTLFNASLLSLGNFGDADRGNWLVSVRRGNLDYVFDIADPGFGGPKYQDMLAHIGWEWSDRTRIGGNLLASNDKISMFDPESTGYATAQYENRVVWLSSETDWNGSLSSRTIVSATEIENLRAGFADTPGVVTGNVDDRSKFQSFGLKQDWEYDMSKQWMARAGFDYKNLEARYRYESQVVTFPPFADFLDNVPFLARDLELAPRGAQYAAYLETRWQPVRALTLDTGLRWDRQTYTTAIHDSQFSPRVNLLYSTSGNSELRLGWGQFYQAQEINELQIRDGLVQFYPAQRAKHLVGSLSHDFENGLEVRAEIYRKSFRSLHPRFENLFDPHVLLPELQADRVRIDAGSASTRGAELTVARASTGEALRWWASYAWAEVKDEFDDGDLVRAWDQTHAVKAGFNWSPGRWSISAAAVVHTGWPKTALIGEYVTDANGFPILTLSTTPRNGLRYSQFQSLDMRLSRQFDVSKGDLIGFLEITNLYNRNNPCCLEYTVATDLDGNQVLQMRQRNWLPLMPSLGIIWRF